MKFAVRTRLYYVMTPNDASITSHSPARGAVISSEQVGFTPTSEAPLLNLQELSEPPDIDLKMWPVLDDAAKHGLAWEVATAATEYTEADPVAVLLTFLTYAATYFGRKAYVPIGDDEHSPRLFTLLIGATSIARKGTSEGCVAKIAKRTNEILSSRSIPQPQIKSCSISSGEGLIMAVRDESEDRDATGKPKHDAAKDKRLLVSDGEFNNYFSNAKREGNNASMLVRNAWDGKTLEPLTKVDRIKATDAHINILGHITQEEFIKNAPGIEHYNGGLNRFLVVMVKRSKIVALPPKTSNDEIDAFAARLAAAAQYAYEYGGETNLDDEAERLWRNEIYPRLSNDSSSGVIAAATARSAPYVLRVALVFAMLDQSTTINALHLKAASAVIDYSKASIKYIFEHGDQSDNTAHKIIEKLSTAPGRRMMHSDLKKAVNCKNDRDKFAKAAQLLEATGKVKIERVKRGNIASQYIELV